MFVLNLSITVIYLLIDLSNDTINSTINSTIKDKERNRRRASISYHDNCSLCPGFKASQEGKLAQDCILAIKTTDIVILDDKTLTTTQDIKCSRIIEVVRFLLSLLREKLMHNEELLEISQSEGYNYCLRSSDHKVVHIPSTVYRL